MIRKLLPVYVGLAVLAHAGQARSAVPSPAWSVHAVSRPTRLPVSETGYISVLVTNDGAAPSSGKMTIEDRVPGSLSIGSVVAVVSPKARAPVAVACPVEANKITCSYESAIAADNTEGISITIAVSSREHREETVTNAVTVSGGAASEAATEQSFAVSAVDPPFAIASSELSLLNAGGAPDRIAGSHPSLLTVGLTLNTVLGGENGKTFESVQSPKSLTVELPAGLLGYPRATPRCKQSELLSESGCPPNTAVGTVAYWGPEAEVSMTGQAFTPITRIFNMEPEGSYPAKFAFAQNKHPIDIYANLVPEGGDYALRLTVPAVPPTSQLGGVLLSFFGEPSEVDGLGATGGALFTTSSDCGSSGQAVFRLTSWTQPSGVGAIEDEVTMPATTECELLNFFPSVQVAPETTVADTPSGIDVAFTLPPNEAPTGIAVPPIQSVVATLPPGMSLSLPATNGLIACTAAQFGRGEERPGEEGEPQPSKGECPPGSKIGTARISTPLLGEELDGNIYLAVPECAPCTETQIEEGKLLHAYAEAAGDGVVVKLDASVEVGGAAGRNGLQPGQVRLRLPAEGTFPQLPVSHLQLHLNGGPRAVLDTPSACGDARIETDLQPWSATTEAGVATPEADFGVTWLGGGQCPSTKPFQPGFSAGAKNPAGGAFAPFSIVLSGADREQSLSSLRVSLPAGETAVVSGIPRCPEPQAAVGQCAAGSQIGHVQLALGPGPEPLWVEGDVYLTAPYDGAPFGLSLVIPGKAGPFDLGDVVVRAGALWNSSTGGLSVVTGMLPTSVNGVPLQLRTIVLNLDRPHFMLNPSNCSQMRIEATVTGGEGASVSRSTPFAAANCANLPFKPTLTAHTSAATSRKNGAELHIGLYSSPGQADIAKVRIVLPRQLSTRLSALQHACPLSVYAASPARCPAGSRIGSAVLHTPLIAAPLSGTAYFVSQGGRGFPYVHLLLSGEGVTVDLEGHTDIHHGITTAYFDSVPDMPLSSISLVLPEGRNSLLAAADGSLCAQPLKLPTSIVAQNGVKVDSVTHLAVSGCPRKRAAHAHTG